MTGESTSKRWECGDCCDPGKGFYVEFLSRAEACLEVILDEEVMEPHVLGEVIRIGKETLEQKFLSKQKS